MRFVVTVLEEQLRHLFRDVRRFLARKMFTSNCSATSPSKRSAAIRQAMELARSLQLPLLATNGVCHALPEQREILDVFSCLRHHRVLTNAGRLLSYNTERYLKSPAQMAALFADLPEAIANTTELASRLKFTMK